MKRLAAGLLAAVIALDLTYVLVDFHVAFARTGGRPAVFPLGSRLDETSDHFMRTDRLYQQLADRRVQGVLADHFLATTLAYHELVEGRGVMLGVLPVRALPRGREAPPLAALRAAARRSRRSLAGTRRPH